MRKLNAELMKKYAELIIKVGVNMQRGQYVVISSDITHYGFVRILTETAYENGAREVIVDWYDDIITHERYLHCDDFILNSIYEWRIKFFEEFDKRDACYIGINNYTLYNFNDIEIDKFKVVRLATNTHLSYHKHLLNEFKLQWVTVELPSVEWAAKVFPDTSPDEAYQKLCEVFIKINRLDSEYPISAWKQHTESLIKVCHNLKSLKIKRLTFENSLGTCFSLDLPEQHDWIGGVVESQNSIIFTPNIPTEEIFTAPQKMSVNGKVCVTRPIYYNGKLIRDIELIFEDGKVVKSNASINGDLLDKLINTDEGARYMGEIALVSEKQAAFYKDIFFYNNLYDENASCHFALGRAYPKCLKESLTKEPGENNTDILNDSAIHIDLMFGTSDLNIKATTQDNEIVKIDI